MLDNGYAFVAEQPLHVMADFCAEWLRLQELWEEIPAYTALALQSAPLQAQVQAQIEGLHQQVQQLSWQVWAADGTSSAMAQELLNTLQWPAKLERAELFRQLGQHTYGTFSTAL